MKGSETILKLCVSGQIILTISSQLEQCTDPLVGAKDTSTIKQQHPRRTKIFLRGCRAGGGHSRVTLVKSKCEGNCDEQGGLLLGKRMKGEGGDKSEHIKNREETGEDGVKEGGRGAQPWLWDVMNPGVNVSSVQDPQVKECFPPYSSFVYQPHVGH